MDCESLGEPMSRASSHCDTCGREGGGMDLFTNAQSYIMYQKSVKYKLLHVHGRALITLMTLLCSLVPRLYPCARTQTNQKVYSLSVHF